MEKDLNIHHYDFDDLLRVFKIESVTTIEKRKSVLSKVSPSILPFYQKAYSILAGINEFINQSFFEETNEEAIEIHMKKIKDKK